MIEQQFPGSGLIEDLRGVFDTPPTHCDAIKQGLDFGKGDRVPFQHNGMVHDFLERLVGSK